MSAITTVLSVFLSMTMVTMANSVAALLKSDAAAQQWFFVAFFILLRVKLYLDDLNYCSSADRKCHKFKLEFSAGMVFWFPWIAVAAILPTHYMIACFILSGTILLGTLILFFTSNQPRRYSFIKFNILYTVLLLSSAFLSLACWALSAITMFVAVFGVLWDFKRNASFDVFERP